MHIYFLIKHLFINTRSKYAQINKIHSKSLLLLMVTRACSAAQAVNTMATYFRWARRCFSRRTTARARARGRTSGQVGEETDV